MSKIKVIPEHLLGVTRFDVQISDVEPVNGLFSKCIIKILYPGLNQNRVFISKEVANEMAKTLYNIPIVGEYIEHKSDFGSHGGKIVITDDSIEFIQTTKPWGLIPESTEIAWQDVLEQDGTRNEYLTATGYLWTGRYPELIDVIESGRAQSMELYEDTLEGNWEVRGGQEIFNITKADFSALCILGNDVPPAFESASIGSYYVSNPISFSKKYSRLLRDFETSKPDLIEQKVVNFSSSANDNKGTPKDEGGQNMSLQFKMDLDTDNIKYKLYDLLHPVNAETNERVWEYSIIKVNDDNIVVSHEETNKFYEINYTIENDQITLNEDKIEFNFETESSTQNEDRTEIESLQKQYTELQVEFNEYKNQNTTDELDSLRQKNAVLQAFKSEAESTAKEVTISEFTDMLTEEELEPFKTKIAEYTQNDLEKELALMAFKKKKLITDSSLIPDPNNTPNISGSERIIQKHHPKTG